MLALIVGLMLGTVIGLFLAAILGAKSYQDYINEVSDAYQHGVEAERKRWEAREQTWTTTDVVQRIGEWPTS